MALEQIVVQVAAQLCEVARRGFGRHASRKIVGTAWSGDHTYALDMNTEDALHDAVQEIGNRHHFRLAYYSEDRGLVVVHSDPEYVLIVDPIDGTRPAVCGLESCCVSIALAPLRDQVTLDDVEAACLIEIKSGYVLWARRGLGVRQCAAQDLVNSRPVKSGISTQADLSRMFWTHEVCGRPAQATHAVLGDLINLSSHAGGCFVMNSSSYAISRVIVGQLDAYVDFYGALLQGDHADKWQELSRDLFGGTVFGLFPYDIAAAWFLAQESGAYIVEATGGSIGGTKLLNSSADVRLSCIVASNHALGKQLYEQVNKGISSAYHKVFSHSV